MSLGMARATLDRVLVQGLNSEMVKRNIGLIWRPDERVSPGGKSQSLGYFWPDQLAGCHLHRMGQLGKDLALGRGGGK